MTFAERFKLILHYSLPKYFLTRLAGYFAEKRCGWLTQFAIKRFIKAYQVKMHEAAAPSPKAYATFNDFFTRALQSGARPLAQGVDFIQPVDGQVSQFGALQNGQLIQAKNHNYELADLLGSAAFKNDKDPWLEAFEGGTFATLYLAPKDYHRIHMPCDAVLREMRYIPGRLLSVNPFTATHVPNLFARNERLVALFDTAKGPMSMVLVGATIVGSIETTWAGTINSSRSKRVHTWQYPSEGSQAVTFKQGEEMGRFKLGSTVILTFGSSQEPETASFEFDLKMAIGAPVRMGEAFANFKSPKENEVLEVETKAAKPVLQDASCEEALTLKDESSAEEATTVVAEATVDVEQAEEAEKNSTAENSTDTQ